MIEGLPGYVSVTLILSTFFAVGSLFYAIRRSVFETAPAKAAVFLITFWLIFQAVAALGGTYIDAASVPPRIFLFGVLPAILLIAIYFVFFRARFIERLPLKTLTLLHIVRIPVEFVLLWLFQAGLVPREMTFEGRNFDILSGITAPLIFWLAFRGGRVNRPLLIAWNVLALILLVNIVSTAIMAFPGPIQQIAFEHPNRGVLYFPFIWLPTIIVPIVLFSHLTVLWNTVFPRNVPGP